MSENETTKDKPDLDRLRAEIQLTRAELGETVQALAAKADVKARAKDQLDQTKDRVLTAAGDAGARVRTVAADAGERVRTGVRTSPVPVSLVVAGLAALAGIILIIRGRRA
jgi:ElaB/YqjD/DUF883 family membrane-anchored ribosome-binding protein